MFYALLSFAALAAHVGYEFGFARGRQYEAERRAMYERNRPQPTRAHFVLPCPPLNREAVIEWHRICRHRKNSDTIKGK